MIRFHDMFCGAGGTTDGAVQAGAVPVVGMNHWPTACQSYEANHAAKGARAACVDVVTQDPRRYPRADLLLASPECTHHSYARGRPKDDPSLFDPDGDQAAERSRATMWDVCRFAEVHHYRAIIVENVEAAVKWGLPRGKKLAHGAYGPLFAAWLNAMAALDYEFELVHLNSMIVGVPQSRDRLYVVFWKKGQRRPDLDIPALGVCPRCVCLVYGEQRMKREGATTGVLGRQYVYGCPTCGTALDLAVVPAAAAIDWDLEGGVIGERPVPLRPATMERIRRGVIRLRTRRPALRLPNGLVVQVGGNLFEREGYARAWPVSDPLTTVTATADRALVVPTTHTDPSQRGRPASDEPLPAQTGRQEQALVLSNNTNNIPKLAGDEAMGTVTTGDRLYLVYAGRDNNVPRLADAETMQTQTRINALYVVGVDGAIVEMRGDPERPGGGNAPRLVDDEAMGTVSAQGNHHGLVVANYGSQGARPGKDGWSRHADDGPLGTVTATDSHALFSYREGVEPRSLAEPIPTQTGKSQHAIFTYRGTGDARDPDEPLPTIASLEQQALLGDVTQEDIAKCTFRMLQPHELKVGSGFPLEYVLHGKKRDRVAQIGNAVNPPASRELVQRVLASLDEKGS
jgi:DNA (cytosine-5)-methyltransferase 1